MPSNFYIPVEIREDLTRQSPGRLVGRLLTYGERAQDRAEVFEDNALEWDAGGVVLDLQHNRRRPVVRFTPEVVGREVRVDVPLPDTLDGRDAATLVRNGTLRELSIAFVALEEFEKNGLRVVKRARLVGAGLVDSGAYDAPVAVRARRRLWL